MNATHTPFKKPKLAVPLSSKTKMYIRLMNEEQAGEHERKEQLAKAKAGWRYLKGLDDRILVDTERDILKKNV